MCRRGFFYLESRVSTVVRVCEKNREHDENEKSLFSRFGFFRGVHHVPVRCWRWSAFASISDHRLTSPPHRVLRRGSTKGLQSGKHS